MTNDRREQTMAIGTLIGDLANTVRNIEDRVEECKRYIYSAHKRHENLITSLDNVIQAQEEDLQSFVVTMRDGMADGWPTLPYFMRKDDY